MLTCEDTRTDAQQHLQLHSLLGAQPCVYQGWVVSTRKRFFLCWAWLAELQGACSWLRGKRVVWEVHGCWASSALAWTRTSLLFSAGCPLKACGAGAVIASKSAYVCYWGLDRNFEGVRQPKVKPVVVQEVHGCRASSALTQDFTRVTISASCSLMDASHAQKRLNYLWIPRR